jgi:hypothetical protein
MKASLILIVALLVFGTSTARAQQSQPEARKFDEFTAGIGSPNYRSGNWDQQQQEVKNRLVMYGKELRKAGARPYAITYSPRVVRWEIYERSIAEMRAGALWGLTPLADWRNINIVNGGFREIAATELWIVPPGAQPPCPTPTVRPEAVVYCPAVRITSVPFAPHAETPINFKAHVQASRDKAKPLYSWEVSQGEILAGQGTDTITVKVRPGSEGEVIARVTLSGFALDCPVEATTSISRTAYGVRHYLFEEFGKINMEDELARLDNLAIVLQNDPTFQVHLVFYGGRSGPRGEAAATAARARDYLINQRGLGSERVLTVDGGYRDHVSGEYWLSLQGTEAPATRSTVDRHYVKPGVRKR